MAIITARALTANTYMKREVRSSAAEIATRYSVRPVVSELKIDLFNTHFTVAFEGPVETAKRAAEAFRGVRFL